MADSQNGSKTIESFDVRILRQDGPGQPSYWERHRVTYQPDMNVISALQSIARQATTADGKKVTPVVWDCNCLEEVCGACTMVVNGRVRQACSALVDGLLEEHPGEIELKPASSFPVIRDLMVDRSRLYHALKRARIWVNVDGYHDMGAGPLQSQGEQEQLYPLSQCMSCGCCLEACPQFKLIDVQRRPDESDDEFERRKAGAFEAGFIGPHAISQAMLFNAHPTGKHLADERLDVLTAAGGIQVCGNAQNCVAVCPKEIPLTTSIARAGRATTWHAIKNWLDK